jgi:hypothetical protein
VEYTRGGGRGVGSFGRFVRTHKETVITAEKAKYIQHQKRQRLEDFDEELMLDEDDD